MESKKTIIAIIIVTILIIAILGGTFVFNKFNANQINLLTEESNKILQLNIATDSIDFKIKTEKNYAIVEKAIKEYISKIKNIYIEIEELNNGINPNIIFTAENMQDKNLDEIDSIIEEYKNKSQNCITEYENLVKKEQIQENINNKHISIRKKYYTELYNTVMISDTMQNKYTSLEEKIKDEKSEIYEKLNKIEKIKKYLEQHEESWTIKENKIQFNNINRMAEYYNLLNQLTD